MNLLPLAVLWWLFGDRLKMPTSKDRPSPTKPVLPPPGKWPSPTTATTTTTTTTATTAKTSPPSKSTALQPLPGDGWKPYNPPPRAVVSRALALLPRLNMGQWLTEPDPTDDTKEVAYRKEPHPAGKTGVTAYVRQAVVSGDEQAAEGEDALEGEKPEVNLVANPPTV